MSHTQPTHPQHDPEKLLQILEISRRLSAPSTLDELLGMVIDAGRAVLTAERGAIFLYDAGTRELYSSVATGGQQIRFGIGQGIAGHCARAREVTNVTDCYTDPRFNQEVDRATGYRTRALMALPLIGLEDELVGVFELLNPAKPCFDEGDIRIASILASQAAAAIQRTRLLEDRLEKIKLRRDLAIARRIQMNVLPSRLPEVPGYDMAGFSLPAEETGGDIYDVLVAHPVLAHDPHGPTLLDTSPDQLDRQTRPGDSPVLMLLADASGHGIGPALSVTQVRAMVRIAAQLTNDLDTLFLMVGRQLSEDATEGRFVTAFLGLLDHLQHRVDYHAGGQGPLLHLKADGAHTWLGASTLPLGIKHLSITLARPEPILLSPGDTLVLLTDGFYEHTNPAADLFGPDRVLEVCRSHPNATAKELLGHLYDAVIRFGDGAPQMDDFSGLILRRL